MEIVTINNEESLRYGGRLVKKSNIRKIHDRRLPHEAYRRALEFDVYSYIGHQLRDIDPELHQAYLKSKGIMKYAGPVQIAYVRYGHYGGYRFHSTLPVLEAYVFSKLTTWARTRLYIPFDKAANLNHPTALMYPRYFQDWSRGFMVYRETLDVLKESNLRTGRMLDAINGKLVIIE